MPTLLQINVSANCGSHGKIAENIGVLAQNRGWRSVIAYGRRAYPSQNELIHIGSNINIKEHGIESRLFDNHGLASRTSTHKFIRQIDEINPSVIHLHNIHGYYLNYRILFNYLKTKSIPTVWTFHDCWPFTGHCAYFDFEQCQLWKTGCHPPCPCKRNYPKSVFVDASSRNWTLKKNLFTSLHNITLVPVSEWLSVLLQQSFLRDFPIQVIHNGIDLEVFNSCDDTQEMTGRYGLQNKRIVLGVANKWEERKGLRDFIALKKILPNNYGIIIVGVNAKQQLSLPEGIIGINRTQNQKELAKLYSMADIYLNLTYEDNYPTTNLEAMACGTPVLTYRTGGSPEAIDINTGWVVDQGDLSSVRDILMSMRKTKEISAYCRQRACANFDKNTCFESYLDLYEKIKHF